MVKHLNQIEKVRTELQKWIRENRVMPVKVELQSLGQF